MNGFLAFVAFLLIFGVPLALVGIWLNRQIKTRTDRWLRRRFGLSDEGGES